MDSYRGQWLDRGSIDDAVESGADAADDAAKVHVSPVGQDERRMQVRAYNHWASLLENRNFPSIEDLEPEDLPDFGPHSVLLDFTSGIDNPGIAYLGAELARECGTDQGIDTLDDVPSRSLLSRITDHYMQILANQAPIGFEAEFVNQRDRTILYRGILLPFSTDDDTIDFIYGVINWKEMTDARTTDELLLEVDHALDPLSGGADDDILDLGAWSAESVQEPTAFVPQLVETAVFAPESDANGADDHGGEADGADDQRGEAEADTLDDHGDGHEFGAVRLSGVSPIAFPEPAFGAPRALGIDEPANEDNLPPLLATKPSTPTSRVLPGYAPELEDLDDEELDAAEEDLAADAFGSLMGAHDAPDEPEFDEEDAEDTAAIGDEHGAASAHHAGAEPAIAQAQAVRPLFVAHPGTEVSEDEDEDEDDADIAAANPFASLLAPRKTSAILPPKPADAPVFAAIEEPAADAATGLADTLADSLADTLAVARELAHQAIHSEDRTRSALYAAVSRAYDVSLAAAESPREFAEIVADAGLTVQDRAPMTPVVKLVFGANYDKTRLAEFASALSHAHRIGVGRGELAGLLGSVSGGLKQVVAAERKLRREEAGLAEVRDTPSEALARKLRQLDYRAMDSVAAEGSEFTLLVARRLPTGEVVLLGEVAEDVALLEKAARKLIG